MKGHLPALPRKASAPLSFGVDFRYSNRVRFGVDDVERTARAVQGAVGKRLTYRTTSH